MKRILIFLIGILSVSCATQTDINNNQYIAKIVDFDLNCSTCILQFPFDSAQVAQKIGSNNNLSYQAINLNNKDFKIGQLIKANIREAEDRELQSCISLNPSFDYQNIYVIDYEKYSDFEYNDTTDLRYGNCINDYSNKTTFCFDSVITDSRCPENVICVWAGEAIVRFRIIKDRNEPVFLDLHVSTIDTIVFDYKFSFLNLLPYPNTEIQRDINEYVAKVIIKRN